VILLDTNVLSELTRLRPAPRVVEWLSENEPRLALPTITLAELRYGIARLPAGKRQRSLLVFWTQTRQRFVGRTFSFDSKAAEVYGEVVAEAERRGRSIKVGDGQIAAIGLSQGMAVATRDTDDFTPTGVRLINPWE
jgi:predicted nucleic acid-binding protein